MIDEQYIRDRISVLRTNKGISEYKMSLDLGHSKSYIQSIVSGRAMPSMSEFLYICEYLGVTPREFFDTDTENPVLLEQVTDALKSLSTSDLALVMELIERLSKDL